MAKQLLFFATREDLEPLLAAIERHVPIEYLRMGMFTTSVAERYATRDEIPDFDRPVTDTASTSGEFLVVPKGQLVEVRRVRGTDGTIR